MSNFKILLSSDLSYEEVVAEIYYDDKYVGLINQDDPKNILFVLPSDCDPSFVAKELPLNILIESIQVAMEKLGHNVKSDVTIVSGST
jgi:hypothetical protein